MSAGDADVTINVRGTVYGAERARCVCVCVCVCVYGGSTRAGALGVIGSCVHAGPVINDPWNDAYSNISGAGSVPLALQWVSIMPGVADTTMDAFTGINFAQNFSDFRAALQSCVGAWAMPCARARFSDE